MKGPIPKTMRALVYRGANDLQLEKVPVPRIGRNELLVRVAVCGICPTDLKKIQAGRLSGPRIFGHEIAGTVVAVGPGLKSFREGERVALHHHVPCLRCHWCRHLAFAHCPQYLKTGTTAGFEPSGGGFAEYVRVMPFVLPGVVKIPDRNSFEEGAMLEPVNTVLKGIRRLSLLRGDQVLVMGQGPIGLMFTRLLRRLGMAAWVSDLLPARQRLGIRFGGREWPGETAKKGHERGLDAVVVTVPSAAAVAQAFAGVRPAGKVLLFGHTERGSRGEVDFGQVCRDEVDILGSYSSDFTLQREVSALVFGGVMKIESLVTHRFALSQGLDGIKLASTPTEQSLKVMLAANEADLGSAEGKPAKRLRL